MEYVLGCGALAVKEYVIPNVDCDGVSQFAIGMGTLLKVYEGECTPEIQYILQLPADQESYERAESDAYIKVLIEIQRCLP